MDVFEKLYIARTLLSLNQKEAAEQAGINPVAIGNLERGERNAVPESYAAFLYQHGIDLNWIFNTDGDTANVFRKEKNIDETNNNTDKLINQSADKNVFINQDVLETKHLTHTLFKHVDKLLDELSEIKKLNKKLLKKQEKVN